MKPKPLDYAKPEPKPKWMTPHRQMSLAMMALFHLLLLVLAALVFVWLGSGPSGL
jgi:hypothetical protein